MSLGRALLGLRQRLLALLHDDAETLELVAPQALGVHEDAGLLLQHVAQHDALDQAHAEGEIGALDVERPEGRDGVTQVFVARLRVVDPSAGRAHGRIEDGLLRARVHVQLVDDAVEQRTPLAVTGVHPLQLDEQLADAAMVLRDEVRDAHGQRPLRGSRRGHVGSSTGFTSRVSSWSPGAASRSTGVSSAYSVGAVFAAGSGSREVTRCSPAASSSAGSAARTRSTPAASMRRRTTDSDGDPSPFTTR